MAATAPSPGPGPAPRVTVVLLTYNHAPFIAEALDSVLMQQTTFPVELVVVEDCSTDGTQDILRRYQAQHPERIRLVLAASNQNDNVAWGQAIVGARGDYVALLDGDDYWTSPRKLQTQVEFLDAYGGCAIGFHNALLVFDDGSEPSRPYNGATQAARSTIADLWMRNFMATSSVMLRRRVLTRLPEWHAALPFGDWPLFFLYAEHGDIGFLPATMSVYRRHRGGIFGGMSEAGQLKSILLFYEAIRPHYESRYAPQLDQAVAWHRVLLLKAYVEAGDGESARATLSPLFRSGFGTLLPHWRQLLQLAPSVARLTLRSGEGHRP